MLRLLFWIFRGLAGISAILFLIVGVLWFRSQGTFLRVTQVYATGAAEQREVVLLTWRDAVEIETRTEVYHPEDAAVAANLRRDLVDAPRRIVYEHSGWSTSDPGGNADAAAHWGFWYRNPDESRNSTIAISATKYVGNGLYTVTDENERAFFLPWWFVMLIFGALPACSCWRTFAERCG